MKTNTGTESKTLTVWVVLPAKPEHFAYGPYPSREAASRDPEIEKETGVIRELVGVPTWTYATKNDWWAFCYKNGAKIVHNDGTPWTEEDWNKPHPDAGEINKRIWPRRLSGI